MTYDEWLRMPEVQDATEEVIDGEIRISPPAKWVHAEAVGNIRYVLRDQFDDDRFFVVTARFGLVIRKEPLTVRCPDLAVFDKDTIVEQDGFIHSPPQLIAEVLAPGEDLNRKLADYASLGVPEVWVVSPESQTVEVLISEEGRLHTAQTLSDGVFQSPQGRPLETIAPVASRMEAMASLPNSKAVTYEEWLRMPEVTDAIEEVVNGEIRMIPEPKWKHHRIIELTQRALERQVDTDRFSFAEAGFSLVIRKSPQRTRVPDLAIIELATLIEQDGYIHSTPQLLVEVLSPSNTRREREEKLNDYAAIGVPEVWVISPEARTVEVLYLEDGFLRSSHVLVNGALTPKLFPQVSVEIAKIWPD